MDLNEVPSDHMPKIETNGRINVSEVENKCLAVQIQNKDVELDEIRGKIRVLDDERLKIEEEIKGLRKVEARNVEIEAVSGGLLSNEGNVVDENNCIALQIQNKGVELDEIRGKIRVLDDERLKFEEEIKGLRKAEAQNIEIEAASCGLSSNKGNVVVGGSDNEELKVDELMDKIRVLECERNTAVMEVEEWKRKCEEFELRVRELEEQLKCHEKDGGVNDVYDVVKDVNVGVSSNFGPGTSSPRVVDGGIQTEGAFSTVKQAKRRLSFCSQRSCDQKVAPSTRAGERAFVAVVDMDSDHEMPGGGDNGTNGAAVEEDEIIGEESDTSVKNPKRKRDRTVVASDDEPEENEVLPKRRALRIDNSDNEGEEEDDGGDDLLPIKHIFNGDKSNCESDDDDNVPISQIKVNRNRGHGSRRSARLQEKKNSGRVSASRPRRRLVKPGPSPQKDRTRKKKFVEDEESEEDDSSSDHSLSDFIVSDADGEESEDIGVPEDDLPENDSCNPHEDDAQSDDSADYEDIMSKLQRRKDPNSKWAFEADMLSEFGKNPELCMRGVCALNRRQIAKEQSWEEYLGQGFSKFDAPRGRMISDFLTDGNPDGDVVKTVEELQAYYPEGPEICRTLAVHYSNQLFEMYNTNEDEFFP